MRETLMRAKLAPNLPQTWKIPKQKRRALLHAREFAARPALMGRIEDAFMAFDTDGNGVLTADEMLAILTRGTTGSALTIEDAKEVSAIFAPLRRCVHSKEHTSAHSLRSTRRAAR